MGDLAGDDGAGTSIAEYCMADWPTFVTVEGIDMKKKKTDNKCVLVMKMHSKTKEAVCLSNTDCIFSV